MNEHGKYIPYTVIEEAIKGDAEALQMILDHYDGYIKKISAVKMIDEFGDEHFVADVHLCDILKVHLITAIIKFDVRL